tara:strand:- start:77 stop:1552 length:1476 start_codon:yes stop_codon:yes gene_type:complete
MGKSKPIKVFGKKYLSINDAADSVKKDRKLVHMRLFLGWSIEDALTKPNQRCNSVTAFGKKFKNLSIAAKEHGLDPEITRNKYKRLLKEGFVREKALEKAITDPNLRRQSISIFGETHESLTAAAKHYKVNYQTLQGRLKAHWTPEDAVTRPILKNIELEVDGKVFKSIAKLANHYKLGYKLVYKRIRVFKWAAKEAVTLPKQIGRTIHLNGKEYSSITAAALAIGVARSSATYRLSAGWSLEEAFDPNAEVDNRKSIIVDGEHFETHSDAARNFGIQENTFFSRINKGWSPEQAAGLIPPAENKGGPLPINPEEYRDRLYEIHGDDLDFSESQFQKAHDKIVVRCNGKQVHPTFKATPNNLLSGKGCPICKLSMGAKRIARWLEQRNLFYEAEWTGHGLRSKKYDRATLRCDFYVPRHRIIIEFDGQQHFEPFCFGNQTEEQAIAAYHVLVENDKRKNKWAEENDHHMIRIRYDELVSEVLSNDKVLGGV